MSKKFEKILSEALLEAAKKIAKEASLQQLEEFFYNTDPNTIFSILKECIVENLCYEIKERYIGKESMCDNENEILVRLVTISDIQDEKKLMRIINSNGVDLFIKARAVKNIKKTENLMVIFRNTEFQNVLRKGALDNISSQAALEEISLTSSYEEAFRCLAIEKLQKEGPLKKLAFSKIEKPVIKEAALERLSILQF